MIKDILKYATCTCGAMIITASCQRQEIYNPEYLLAYIPITIDWSSSLVDESQINNVSVYFYPVDGSEPTIAYCTEPSFTTVSLYKGEYNILIHNEMFGNITGVDCADNNSFEGYKMSIQQDNSANYDMFYTATSEEQLIKECEQVAVWSYRNFTVSDDMIEYTRSDSFDDFLTTARSKGSTIPTESLLTFYQSYLYDDSLDAQTKADTKTVTKSLEELLGVTPTPLTTTFEVNLEIDNLNNIQYIEGVISGFVDGATLYNKEKSSTSSSNYTYFTMSDYTYNDGSTTDGVLTYEFTNMGHRGYASEKYYINLNIVLHSGELVNEIIDITDQLVGYEQDEVVTINIGYSFDNDTPTIVLPSNIGTGFGVGEWGEAQNVDLG